MSEASPPPLPDDHSDEPDLRYRVTLQRGFAIVIGSGLVFGFVGALIGLFIGRTSPALYRSVFERSDAPDFDPVRIGLILGGVQGSLVGLGVGAVVLLAFVWSNRPGCRHRSGYEP